MRVPFLDLSRQTAALRRDLDAAVTAVLDASVFVGGDPVASFEQAWAAACGAEHAVGVASGTGAIALALRAVGVSGGEVITVANTCVPTVSAIRDAGATPVLVDCDPRTLLMDANRVAEAVTERTQAIVPVHLYGARVDVDALRAFGVPIVEDAAQGHGLRIAGDAAAYSFYPTKNLGAFGDAGAIVTNDPHVAERARLLRNYGEAERYDSVVEGTNSRLDTLQASILLAKLPRLGAWLERRNELAERYLAALGVTAVRLPERGADHVWHLFVVRVPDRDRFRAALAEAGVETLVHYPRAVHQHAAYAGLATRPCPEAEAAAAEVVSLPLFPELDDEEADRVIAAVAAARA